jgi:Nucleotide-diphospho-sugar transferase
VRNLACISFIVVVTIIGTIRWNVLQTISHVKHVSSGAIPGACISNTISAEKPASNVRPGTLFSEQTSSSDLGELLRNILLERPGEGVMFTAGNKAMNEMIRNWMISASRTSKLAYFAAPIDKEGFEDLVKHNVTPIFVDEAAHGKFKAGGSEYGKSDYGDMSAFKWQLAKRIVDAGVGALMSDPDIVVLRNPLPYISTLPSCDIYIQLDVDYEGTFDSVKSRGGFELVNQRNFFCGGFAYFAPTLRTKSHLEYFLDKLSTTRAADATLEEQTVWNRMMTQEFSYEGMAENIAAGNCTVFKSNSGERSVSIWPLSQALFPNTVIYKKLRLHERNLEPPFIVHYNWIYGINPKVMEMRGTGHWYI